MPSNVLAALEAHGVMAAYEARPPYQRNDYIGWITRAKRDETRERRIAQMISELKSGNRYMKMPYRVTRL